MNKKFLPVLLVAAAVAVAAVLLKPVLETRPPDTAKAAPDPSGAATGGAPQQSSPQAPAASAPAGAAPQGGPLAGTGTPQTPSSPGPSPNSPAGPAPDSDPSASSSIASPDEAAAFFASASTPADLLARADLSNPFVRDFVVARMSEIEEERYEAVLQQADQLGIPHRIEGPGNKIAIIHDMDGDRPLYRSTKNRNAAISTNAAAIRSTAPYNLDGSGVTVGVWDGGPVRHTHREFATGNSSRAVRRDSTSSAKPDDHATHVAGTIAASGADPAARGMAPLATIHSYEWNNDYAEMTAAGAATATDSSRLTVSNHSYGIDAGTSDMGRYERECATLDSLANSLPFYLILWAAGNEQQLLASKSGYQSATFNSLAKNILTVGAATDAVSNGLRSPSAAAISSFSSLGPCDDGRIKPDLVANGVGVLSPVSTSNSSYDSYDGTSMATPNAAGSIALLEQLHAREFSGARLRASTLKALLIHTADDIDLPGPDYKTGWGLLNIKAAADLLLAHKASPSSPRLLEGTLSNSTRTANHTFTWDGKSPIRATLCWTDPAGTAQTAADSRTPNLRHNLDLKITAPGGAATFLPFTMPFTGNWTTQAMSRPATTGNNTVDTVEQVRLATPPAPGTYTATVTLANSLSTGSQAYSLVLTGASSLSGNPAPAVAITSPANGATLLPGNRTTLAATATDTASNGSPGAIREVVFRSGNTTLGTATTAPYSIVWTIPSTPGTLTLTATATDAEGATATSAPVTATILSATGAPAISSLSPASARIGDSITINGTNLAAATRTTINGIEAPFTILGPGSLRATVPPGATTGPVAVSTPYGNATSPAALSILAQSVLISQIYGAGGNSGALFDSDYVELHNRGNATASLAGWTLQYASQAGTTWTAATLNGTIAPGKFHLVKLAGGSNGAPLPAADTTSTLNIAATGGKVALRNSATPFTGASPAGQAGLQDLVGYGRPTAFEGTGPAPSPSATTAIFRAGNGTIDTGDNAADFTAAPPAPRHSAAIPGPTPPPPGTAALSEDFSSVTTGNSISTSGSSTVWSGNANFTSAILAYRAGGAIRLGSSTAPGSIFSRPLALNGNFTVTLRVKGWTTVEGPIVIAPSTSSPATLTYTATMEGTFETLTANFSGGTPATTLTIRTTAKRAFLDDITVTPAP